MVPDKPQKVENFHFTWCGYIGIRTRYYVKCMIWFFFQKYNWKYHLSAVLGTVIKCIAQKITGTQMNWTFSLNFKCKSKSQHIFTCIVTQSTYTGLVSALRCATCPSNEYQTKDRIYPYPHFFLWLFIIWKKLEKLQ